MDNDAQKAYVKKQAEERKQLKEEIGRLSKARDAYVAEQKSQAGSPSVSTIEAALTTAIRKQGEKKNFQFSNN